MRAAIARRLRARSAARARALLDHRWEEVETLAVDDRLIGLAGRVVDVHRLKTLDAMHLAAALDTGRPELLFASWDADLRRAARAEGLAIAP
jgi:predicted nucleic acid-binding protein